MTVVATAHPVPAHTSEATVDLRRLSPRDARRLVDIALALARHGVLVVARRGPLLVLRPRHQAPRALAVALRRSFADLGPAFIKFGQLIASSPGLFPAFLSEEFRRLLDDVPAEPARRVRAVIRRELGAPVSALFTSFDDTPLASASIAQVHAATLANGTSVAVKVRRPHLAGRVERDLRLLRLLAAVLQHAGSIGEMTNPVAIVEDFATTLRSELDFRNEAAFMSDFGRNLVSSGHHGAVVVPAPIESMVSPRVLVMTFVDGVAIDDIDTLGGTGHDLEEILRIAVRAWVESALVHGLFHGDVHAGNLVVTREGGVAFLDFGIMGRLDGRTRSVLGRLVPAVLVEGDYRKAVHAVFELGAMGGDAPDLDGAARDLQELVQPLLTARLVDISYGEILGHVLQVATRHSARLPRDLVLVAKQLLYFERYAKRLAPDYQILADSAILAHLLGSGAIDPND
jgi:predicted unusual protein kinase regulating ubiquinone biosynthesis (AarF/ABC1/UbiB family)